MKSQMLKSRASLARFDRVLQPGFRHLAATLRHQPPQGGNTGDMPLGFERINEKRQRPNANINFIKPDVHQSAADQAIAHDFLSRIAAQCYPVMKTNTISVMSLEEFPPNAEFLGRNFNAGECIQLVLKDKGGRWLSFKFVQMVMMHELAHCKQMNHSRFFWNVRNDYAKQMEGLWEKGYHGEGLWGRGKDLASGAFTSDRMPDDVQIPEHLCGGTYKRARGKKRKRGETDGGEQPKVSYAERQQKRIARKFGKHGDGNAIGEDELVRGALDSKAGKRHTGKPKVAKSKRGRDLRANAALARFEAAKAQSPERTPELEDDGSETESGWSSDDDVDSSESIILRRKVGRVTDQNGNDLVQVCGDEGEEDQGGGNEKEELLMLSGKPKDFPPKATTSTKRSSWPGNADEGSETESEAEESTVKPTRSTGTVEKVSKAHALAPQGNLDTEKPRNGPPTRRSVAQNLPDDDETESEAEEQPSVLNREVSVPAPEATRWVPPPAPASTTTSANVLAPKSAHISASTTLVCSICSLENNRSATICLACSNVLKPALMKDHWRCTSQTCAGNKYINAGDAGRCGLCGGQKPPKTTAARGDARPVGIISHDVLRWD
ncbi:hypothetical protein LTR10_003059 [Elasticomyces elasticus]|nr:hypothetical protein LTR10_003059 [Elasticomyces elasticus]